MTRAGRPIELTATEFRLLRYLMLNPRRVMTRRSCSTTSGTTTSAATPGCSRPTSATCARRSTPRPAADPHGARRRVLPCGCRGPDAPVAARAPADRPRRADRPPGSFAAVVTYAEQRSFLLSRVDQQVGDSRLPVAVALERDPSHRERRPPAGRPPRGAAHRARSRPRVPTESCWAPSGKVVHRATRSPMASPLRLRLSLPRQATDLAVRLTRNIHLFTVDSTAGSGLRYRAAAFSLKDGRTLVIGGSAARRRPDASETARRRAAGRRGGDPRPGRARMDRDPPRASAARADRPRGQRDRARQSLSAGRARRMSARRWAGWVRRSNEMLGQIERAFADRGRSEESLRRFLADASHELRTPLASIRGYAELYRLGATSDPAEVEPGDEQDRNRGDPAWAFSWTICCCSRGSRSCRRRRWSRLTSRARRARRPGHAGGCPDREVLVDAGRPVRGARATPSSFARCSRT